MTSQTIPKQALQRLLLSEDVLASATESSSKTSGNSSSIIATEKRILLVEPVLNGTTNAIYEVQYSDVETVVHKIGRDFSQIWINTRDGRSYTLESVEKSNAHDVADTIHKMRSDLRNHQMHSEERNAA
jgi:hypothetical protein